jgi:HflK protein
MTDEQRERVKYYAYAAVVGFLLLLNVTGVFKTIYGIDTAAIITVMAGYKTFNNSISALLEKKISADLALCIAVIAALAVGEYLAAAEAMFIILVGEGLESYAAGRTEAAIHKFVEQLPRRARRLRDGVEEEVDVASLMVDDVIEVRAGERIAADGVIVQGASEIDESTITGESLPRDKHAGAEVYSGTLNGNGLLRIRVLRAGSDTTLARVIQLVEEAKEKRAPVERQADRYAKYFLPLLLLSGFGTWYFTRDWLRTVAVLIVACPCALILATPTAMVAAIGGLARRGILVRSGAILQQAAKVDAVIFDKTGTLTEGKFEILKIVTVERSEDDLLRLAAAAERASDHMLARVICNEARSRGLVIPEPEDARVLPGRGVECVLDGRVLRAGNAALLAEHNLDSLIEEADRIGATAVFVADGDALAGAILLRDRIRQGAREASAELNALGITYQVMLTGDRRRAADAIAREIGVPNVEAELLPEQKLDRIRQLRSQGRFVAMVGDGINDAPALAAANVGIAVHGATDITAEAADVVYLGTSLDKLPRLFDVSRRAVQTAHQNIYVFAGVVNVVAIAACATGVLGPLGAAFTHQVSSFLVMLNSLRLLQVERTAKKRRWSLRLPQIDFRKYGEWLWERRIAAGYVVIALIVLNGFYTLGPDESGVIERFGRKILPYGEPGLHYKLPWPIEKLTRAQVRRVRVIEVGFRSGTPFADAEPASYEWNVQHRSGRFQRKPEESLMLTGDQNMIELNAVVHYRLARPDEFLFNHLDGETTVRTATESVMQSAATTTGIDSVLTTGRRQVEERVKKELQATLDRYVTGVEVLQVRLLDVHPSLEVVDAFRDVSGAYEEKNRLIDVAEGYRNEQVALARGNAEARKLSAAGYSLGRKNRASGDGLRFTQWEEAFKLAPGPNQTRLYLETMEQVLPGKKKMIVDVGRGRRQLILVDDGVEVTAPMMPPRRTSPPEDRE